MRRLMTILIALSLAAAGPVLAEAAGKDKGKGKPAAAEQDKGRATSGEVSTGEVAATIISAAEQVIIGDYVHQARTGGGLPPGLAERERLSPGLQRQIERNGTLPPGLAKRGLPSDLRARLPERPAGQDYRVVGDDIVLIDVATRVILDVMKGVLR